MIASDFTPAEMKLMNTTAPGRDGKQVRGFYSTITKDGYINDLYALNNRDLQITAGVEAGRAMDDQRGWDFSQDSHSFVLFVNTISYYLVLYLSLQLGYYLIKSAINPHLLLLIFLFFES